MSGIGERGRIWIVKEMKWVGHEGEFEPNQAIRGRLKGDEEDEANLFSSFFLFFSFSFQLLGGGEGGAGTKGQSRSGS